MTKYIFIFCKAFKQQLLYRSTTIFNIITSLFYFFIQLSLWKALIGQGVEQSTTFEEMSLYIVINSFILSLTQANISSMIENSIIDGSVSMHILRPISYKGFLLSSILGANSYKCLTSAIPIIIASLIFVKTPSLPFNIYSFFFVVSIIIGILIMFELTYIVGLLAFWIQRCWFLRWYLNAGTVLFGGTVVPLWFYPDALNKISWFLPFRYISFEPINFFLQKTNIIEAILILMLGFVWIILLIVLGRFMWKGAVNKMTVNGG